MTPARHRNRKTCAHPYLNLVCAAVLAAVLSPLIRAEEPPLVLLIQPVPRDERAVDSYRPLADYLEAETGRPCAIEMPPTFPAYWEAVRRNQYDLAFDAPHFTDYRLHKLGFTALAKTPDSASYSLIVRSADRLFDPGQLVAKRIATLGLLSVGALRLNAMYPNARRQPVLTEARSADEALRWLRGNTVDAAFLPTPIVRREIAGGGISVVLTTEPVPHFGFSASPRLAPAVREKIRDALLHAHRNEAGQEMLRAIGLERFDPASADDFANQSYVLRAYWGY